MANILPMGDRVLVEVTPHSEKTSETGIILAVEDKKETMGVVCGVGSKVENDLKVGDLVMFEPQYSEPIKLDGKFYYILSETHIWAVLGE